MNWQVQSLPFETLINTIDVWQIDLDQLDDQSALLSDEERQHSNSMPITVHRQRFINARAVLRLLLGNYLGTLPTIVSLEKTARGKLYLPQKKHLKFNLSHSKNIAIFAFNEYDELGIDIEVKRKLTNIKIITKRMFSSIECGYLSGAIDENDMIDRFFTLWTRKEAIIKATGDGLAAPVNRITTTLKNGLINSNIDYVRSKNLNLIDLPKIKNDIAALAANTTKKHLRYLKLTL